MIPELGKYAGPVLSSYGVGIVLIVGLVWMWMRNARKARSELKQVEDRRNG